MSAISKSKVHALQYAVCMYINILDQVLWGRLKDWYNLNRGFNMEVSELDSKKGRYVKIFPVGWPEGSYIYGRFDGGDKHGWDFWEGGIAAFHLSNETGEPFQVFFQMRHSARWDNVSFSCFANQGSALFKKAAIEQSFTVQD